MFCPMCGCPNYIILGSLGNLVHYRCRDCGAGFSKESKRRKKR